MKVSVVLTTYNGEKYIIQQLESILNQTRKPDEVLIFDDCSSDNTVNLVKEFVTINKLQNYYIFENSKNVGWKRNFISGFNSVSGDIIFPCDQDDIWHLDKIETMASIMENHVEISVLAGRPHYFFENSNGRKISQLLDRMDGSLHNRKKTNSIYNPKGFDDFWLRYPGCVLAIRNSFYKKVYFDSIDKFAHDSLIVYFAKLLGSYYVYDCDVIEWRRRADSSSKAEKMNKQIRIAEIEYDRKMVDHMLDFVNENEECCVEDSLCYLNSVANWNKLREKLVKNGDFLSGVLLIKYISFYTRKRRYISDWKYALR